MIGGKVLDPSAIAAWIEGNLSVLTWLAVAPRLGLVLYVPAMAAQEVATVRPHAAPLIHGDLLAHPQVVRGDLDLHAAGEVDKLLATAGTWDCTAGIVVQAARRRGWPVLTASPARLRLIDPGIEIVPV